MNTRNEHVKLIYNPPTEESWTALHTHERHGQCGWDTEVISKNQFSDIEDARRHIETIRHPEPADSRVVETHIIGDSI